MKNMHTILVDDEVYGLITNDCRQELLRHHPHLIKTRVSMNKIMYHLCRYYVEN